MKIRWQEVLDREQAASEQLLAAQPAVRGRVLAAFLCGYVVLSLLINLVVFRSPWLDPIARATHGWIQPTLLVNLGLIATLVIGLIAALGRLPLRPLIGKPREIMRALGWVAALWIATQAITAAVGLVRGDLALHPSWSRYGAPWLLGGLLAQLVGNALFEELAFRGVLLPQVYQRLRSGKGSWMGIILAVVISQAVFALIHIPNRIYIGLPLASYPMDLFRLMGLGALFAVIYLRTGNLLVAVGIHALLNRPTPLFAGSNSPTLLLGLTVLLLLVWIRGVPPGFLEKAEGGRGAIAPGVHPQNWPSDRQRIGSK